MHGSPCMVSGFKRSKAGLVEIRSRILFSVGAHSEYFSAVNYYSSDFFFASPL